jgi:hypothetical protein
MAVAFGEGGKMSESEKVCALCNGPGRVPVTENDVQRAASTRVLLNTLAVMMRELGDRGVIGCGSSARERPRGVRGKCMKKDDETDRDLEMLDEYDFSSGERGKYAARYAEGTNIVVLSEDVAEIFPDSESVNEALRALAKIIRRQSSKAAV